MEQAITAAGKDGFAGVYSANDGMAGGAIAAMRANGIDPRSKPITGQDAEVAALQRILVGDQLMTDLPADQPDRLDRRRAGGAARQRRGRAVLGHDDRGRQQQLQKSPVGAARHDRDHERQHPGRDHQRRLRDRGRRSARTPTEPRATRPGSDSAMPGARMAAEMAEQPAVLERLIARADAIAAEVRALAPEPLHGSAIVARGSSDHASVYGRYLLELASGRPVSLAAPSLHLLYDAQVDYTGQLAVAVSQSGRTPEIVSTLERLGAAGARTLAITNDGELCAGAGGGRRRRPGGGRRAGRAGDEDGHRAAARVRADRARARAGAVLRRRAAGAAERRRCRAGRSGACPGGGCRARRRHADGRDRARAAVRRRAGGRAEAAGDGRDRRRRLLLRRPPPRPDHDRRGRLPGAGAERRRRPGGGRRRRAGRACCASAARAC